MCGQESVGKEPQGSAFLKEMNEMNAPLYVNILDGTLMPFIKDRMPLNHRFMQDNDPKHTLRFAGRYMEDNEIEWWRTPPESPDINPIENLWHEDLYNQK